MDKWENMKTINQVLEYLKQRRLKRMAKRFYNAEVHSHNNRIAFALDLRQMTVIDQRGKGSWYCLFCNTFNTSSIDAPQPNVVIYAPNKNNEIWIINHHIDGCLS